MSVSLPSPVQRLCLLLLGLSASVTPAGATVITGNSTTLQSLTGTDYLNVQSGASLTSSSSTAAVRWTGSSGAGPVVDNAGTIQNTYASAGRAIDMNFTTLTGSSFTLNNASGASIISVGDTFRINKAIGTGTVAVNNLGTMRSTGTTGATNGQVLDFDANSSGGITINNWGEMISANADAIRPGNGATINNWGAIRGESSGDTGNDGIDFQSAGNFGTVNNYSATSFIAGARHGITAKESITVYNEGTIEGLAGAGLNIDNTSNAVVMSITNAASGRIIGHTVGNGDGDGIDVDHLANIDNAGLIKAIGVAAAGNINEAVAIGGGTIRNRAGASIESAQRAITVDDSNLGNAFGAISILNEGTITGLNGEAIQIISLETNSLVNQGVINGSVRMGAGDDLIRLFTGSLLDGLLDGGDGYDILFLAGAGNGALGPVENIESLRVEGGHWQLGGSLYLMELTGAEILNDVVTNISGKGYDIYYQANLQENAYLGGRMFALSDGGYLKPLPEPAVLALLLPGLALMGYARRQRSPR